MAFVLPELPYAKDALAPHISAETLDYHHGKHHQAYVTNLNKFVEADPSLQGRTLEDLVLTTKGGVYNNAAQIWNHTFYWHCLSPNGGGEPTGDIAARINATWGSFAAFKEKFSAAAVGQFGSGWAWLVQGQDGALEIVGGGAADNPLTHGKRPILTCDVWEHAYYIDYRNARAKYVEAWWSLVNWDFANQNLA
ncbi:MAG TPA: Fe-Mn family superoxide dismutase [Myxococcota bacterium]|nr:Fe-Mn family superoxide dismutase [Myxococcota bacterium]